MPGSVEQRYRLRDAAPGSWWVEVPEPNVPSGWYEVGMVEKLLGSDGWQGLTASGNDVGPAHPSRSHAVQYVIEHHQEAPPYLQDVT